ncbi:hypothetical protein M758_11G011600 [Ceratodon purpureus]|nr:hypothetical protein M758_11G011600 [Ceratodon purpureus]
MRIRKRSQSVAPASTVAPPQLPISCKYQQPGEALVLMRPEYSRGKVECSNMQEARRLDGVQDHESPQSSSDVYAEPRAEPLAMEDLRLSDAHVKRDSDGDLSGSLEQKVTDNGRRRKQSPTKRRKIEHESSLLFEGTSSMTAAELLAVNELANGVRQRLAASEQSTSEQEAKTPPSKPLENSKDALISSIFYIFDTIGDNGLSASEVVKYMLDQQLPGLKEGGARHTVQVANVLRSSSSFISLGDKKYLLCSTLDGRNESSKKSTGSTRQTPAKTVAPRSGSDGKDSSDDDLVQTQNPKPRRKPSVTEKAAPSNTRSNKKAQAEKPKPVTPQAHTVQEVTRQGSSDGEVAEPMVRIARRRGPSSSQKGKGPTQCKRYDGRGWQCSRLTEPGYSLCVHHQDLINKRAAKLKEQQTLSRLMESVNRKAKTQPPAAATEALKPSEPENAKTETGNGNGSLKLKIVLSTKDRDRDHKERDNNSAAPVQKRKMLSLLAIK